MISKSQEGLDNWCYVHLYTCSVVYTSRIAKTVLITSIHCKYAISIVTRSIQYHYMVGLTEPMMTLEEPTTH